MPVGKLLAANDLQPEQRNIIDRLTAPNTSDRIILVQGVAGSGKTTIALSVLREFVTERRSDLKGAAPLTPMLVTFSEKLVEECYSSLVKGVSEEGYARDRIAAQSVIRPGHAVVTSYTDFCERAATVPHPRCLPDRECINILRQLCTARDIDLLPEQVFGIIVGFLKGDPRVRGRSDADIDAALETFGEGQLRAHRSHIAQVRRFIFEAYGDRLRKSWDRADLADYVLKSLREDERYFQRLAHLDASTVRAATESPALKRELEVFMQWLRRILGHLADGLPDPGTAQSHLAVLEEKNWRLSTAEWDRLKETVLRAVPAYGLADLSASESGWGPIRDPIIIVDEVQDLSEIEINVLVRLWFQRRSPRSKLLIFGDINQMVTPTGFTWNRLIEIILETSRIIGDPLDWQPPYTFISAEENFLGGPFAFLPNNYRSTVAVAQFASSMMTDVVARQRAHWEDQLCDRLLRNIVDPDTTLPIQVEEDVKATPEYAQTPGVIVGDAVALQNAVAKVQPSTDEGAPEGNRLVILVGRENVLGAKHIVERPIALIPLLASKGLEFPGVVIAGLPVPETSEHTALDIDILGQWYTALTRSRVRLLLYVSEEEAKRLKELGWDFSDQIAPAERLDDWLKAVGQVEMSEAALTQSGDYCMQRFRKERSEEWLRAAIQAYQQANDQEAVQIAREVGARMLEEMVSFRQACMRTG